MSNNSKHTYIYVPKYILSLNQNLNRIFKFLMMVLKFDYSWTFLFERTFT